MASTRAKPIEMRRPPSVKCFKSGKTCYGSHTEATKAARRHGLHGTAYRCLDCGAHHFTSQPSRLRKAIRYLLQGLP